MPTGEWICRRCKVIPATQIEVRLSGFVNIEQRRNAKVQGSGFTSLACLPYFVQLVKS